jgi:hypothetical protein
MIIHELPDWWPCPNCRCADRDKVAWGDFSTTMTTADDQPDGSPPTFRCHYKTTGAYNCTACETSGRELVLNGASR